MKINKLILSVLPILASCVFSTPSEKMIAACNTKVFVDESKLKLGKVENLDVYNGIKFLKLGTDKKYYQSCFDSITNTKPIDTCILENQLNFLNKNWITTLYFLGDTLTRIKLIRNTSEIPEENTKLNKIFGLPNLQKLQIKRAVFSKAKLNIDDYAGGSTYYENLFQILNDIQPGIKREDYTIQKEYQANDFWIALFSRDNSVENVEVKYYNSILMQSLWGSKAVLQLEIYRHQKINKETFETKFEIDYQVEINMYRNYMSRKYFEGILKENQRSEMLNENIINNNEEQKILKEF